MARQLTINGTLRNLITTIQRELPLGCGNFNGTLPTEVASPGDSLFVFNQVGKQEKSPRKAISFVRGKSIKGKQFETSSVQIYFWELQRRCLPWSNLVFELWNRAASALACRHRK